MRPIARMELLGEILRSWRLRSYCSLQYARTSPGWPMPPWSVTSKCPRRRLGWFENTVNRWKMLHSGWLDKIQKVEARDACAATRTESTELRPPVRRGRVPSARTGYPVHGKPKHPESRIVACSHLIYCNSLPADRPPVPAPVCRYQHRFAGTSTGLPVPAPV